MFLNRLALPNFNDPSKLGKPKEMRETLSNLIAAFESEDLDFSKTALPTTIFLAMPMSIS